MAQQIIKIVLKGNIAGATETRNVFYYGCAADSIAANDYTSCMQALANAITTHLPTLIVDVLNFYEFDCFHSDQEGHWIPGPVAAFNFVGTEGGDFSSFQTAGLLTFFTQVFKCRGRKFLAGIAETSTLAGRLTTAAIAHLVSFIASVLTPVMGAGTGHTWYLGCPSKNSAFAPFVSAGVGSLLSTMRRRKPGYGI